MKIKVFFTVSVCITFLSACQQPQKAEPAPEIHAAPEPDTSKWTDSSTTTTAANQEINTSVTSQKGEKMDLTFTQNKEKEEILIIHKNGETIELKSLISGSGSVYKNDHYEYTEHQGEVILKKDGKTIFEAVQDPNTPISSTEASTLKYTEATNYFVRNDFDAKQLKNPRITNQIDFDKIVGGAAYMGEGGKPTPIHWETTDVIVVLDKKSDRNPIMTIQSVTEKDDIITVAYQIKEYDKTTFFMQPIKVLMIDKKNKSKVVIVKK